MIILGISFRLISANERGKQPSTERDKLSNDFHLICPRIGRYVAVESIPGVAFHGFRLEPFGDGVQDHPHAAIGSVMGVIKCGHDVTLPLAVFFLK